MADIENVVEKAVGATVRRVVRKYVTVPGLMESISALVAAEKDKIDADQVPSPTPSDE